MSNDDVGITTTISSIQNSGTGLKILNAYDDQTIIQANSSTSLCSIINPTSEMSPGTTFSTTLSNSATNVPSSTTSTPCPTCPSCPTPTCPSCPTPTCPSCSPPICPSCPPSTCPTGPTPTCPSCPPSTCPTGPTPTCPSCPTPTCPTGPTPTCPSCPTPTCPSCPPSTCPTGPTPTCPSCPTPTCPTGPTPTCPSCPTPTCPSCPTPTYPSCPTPTCPSCPTPTCPTPTPCPTNPPTTTASSTFSPTTTPPNPCGNGTWVNIENRCFNFDYVKRNWSDAAIACRSLGGVVVTVFNQNDEDFLYSQAQTLPFFIGLNDQAAIGAWVWDQPAGQTLTLNDTNYTNWASGQPDTTDPNKRCVIDQRGWTVSSCNIESFYACEKPTGKLNNEIKLNILVIYVSTSTAASSQSTQPVSVTATQSPASPTAQPTSATPTSPTTAPPNPCGNGTWVNIDNRCFNFDAGLKTWNESQKACHNLGGVLVTVFDQKDEEFLYSQAQNLPYFIGLNDQATVGAWVWDQPAGKNLTLNDTIYTNWAQGQPNINDINKRCVIDQRNVGWTVSSCNIESFYACEKPTLFYISTSTAASSQSTQPVSVTATQSPASPTTQPTSATPTSPTTAPPNPCGNGWVNIENRCFNFDPNSKNWNDASSACHGLGGVLVTVYDQKDTDFLYSQAQTVPFFIGLHDQYNIGVFVWDQPEGKTLTLNDTKYTNWATGQPDLSNANYRCVIDQKGLGWMVSSCDFSSFYACERPINYTIPATTTSVSSSPTTQLTSATPISPTTGPPNPCGNGTWVNIENRCFNFDPVVKTWADASNNCHNLGGVLVTVFDQKDEDFLYSQAQNIPFFIGLHDLYKIGDFVWDQPNGTTLTLNDTKYTNWATGQPDLNNTNYRCVIDQKGLGWMVSSCYVESFYACEKPVSGFVSSTSAVTQSGGTTTQIQVQSTSVSPTSTAPPQNPCGNGTWVNIENRCFNFDPISRNWSDASNACHSVGGVLVTVFDQNDENFLYSQAQNVPFFIGLNDQASNGIWVWDQPSGQTLTLNDTKYTNWANGQPDTSDPNLQCVIDQRDIGWMVGSCNVPSFYACEKPLPSLSSSTPAFTQSTQPVGTATTQTLIQSTSASPTAQTTSIAPTGTSTAPPQNPCGNGTWVNIENRCFNFDAISRNWNDASSACHSQGGVLVTVYDQKDTDFLYSQAQTVPFFIGLHDQYNIGVFIWDQPEGKTLTLNDTKYTNWATGQPDLSNANYRCVIDQKGFGWMVSSCDLSSFYACERPINYTIPATTTSVSSSPTTQLTSATPISPTTGPPNPCGNGTWVNIENRCFNFDPVVKTWADASNNCHNLGGVLVTVFDQKDEDFLYSQAQNIPFFIGLHDLYKIGDFVWDQPNGTTLTLNDTKYTNWATGQPDLNNTNYRCVIDQKGLGWMVSSCYVESFYACEKPVSIFVSSTSAVTQSGGTTTQIQVQSTSVTPSAQSTGTSTAPPQNPCGNGTWVNIENRCFNFDPISRNWSDASNACHSVGGVLVTVFDQNDEIFLYSQAQNVPFFIGLNDQASNGIWVWDQPNGQTLTLNDTKYTNWANGQPDTSDPNLQCVIDQRDIGWMVGSCNVPSFYACEKPSLSSSTPAFTQSTQPVATTTAAQSTSIAPTGTSTAPPQNPCGNGTWVNIENRCFNFDPTSKNWNDASSACHSQGGVLVTVYDQKDTDFLYSQAQTVPFFIGLHDQYNIGVFIWDQPEGKTLTLNDTKYTNWATGQPDLSNANYRCIIDQKGLGWMVSSCDLSSFYACERPINYTIPTTVSASPTTQPTSSTPISPTTGPPNPCGNGTWVNIENRCFNFDPVVKSWADASNSCHNLGGVLVTVFDQKDEDFLYSQAQNIPFFIGLHDLYKIGDFVWDQPNGTTLTLNDTKYTNWATGQPDLNNTNYRCVIDQKGLGWMVSSCYVESFYACEKPVPGLSSSTAAVTQPGGTTASPSAQSTGTSTAPPQNPCGNGTWVNIENRCFNFDAISRNWSDASSACHSQGGVLVTVFDQNDETFLYSQAQNVPFFIGLNDQASNGIWVWDQPNGQTLTLNDTKYTNWANGQPDTSDPNLQCVIDQRDIGWMVGSCNVPSFYACEKPSLSSSTPAFTQSTQPVATTTAAQSTSIAPTGTSTAPPQNPCGNGTWVNIENRCFNFDPTSKNWNDASSTCHSQGGVLVTVYDQKDTDFLYSQAQTVPFFIGLHDQYNIGVFIWDQPEGKTLTLADTNYTNWATGQPDLSNANYRCIIDQKGLGWMVSSCDLSSFYACERPINYTIPATTTSVSSSPTTQLTSATPISPTTGPPNPCGNGTWVNIENRCFNFDPVVKTWADASNNCHNLGGVLVTVFDQKDEDFLYSQAQNIPFFIGLHDLYKIGDFVWDQPNGTTLTLNDTKYTNWATGQPDLNNTNYRCVIDQKGLGWMVSSCYVESFYACEKPVPGLSSSTAAVTQPGGTTASPSAQSTGTSTAPPQNPCGNGTWVNIENRCFNFDPISRNWSDASSACHSQGGVLVTVFDQNDETFLYSQAQNVPFFIGLNDQASNGIWVWDQPNGQTLTLNDTKYTNWANGQPDTSDPNLQCVIDQRDIGWMVGSCNVPSFYACEKPSLSSSTPAFTQSTQPVGTATAAQSTSIAPTGTSTAPPQNPCGNGTWVNIENRCFNFDPTSKNWNDASSACHSQGGVLVTVYDQKDTDFLYSQAQTVPFFIGLHDQYNIGVFIWDQPEGKTLTLTDTNYTNWATGQPDLSNANYRCIIDQKGLGWMVSSCDLSSFYACERPINYTIPTTVSASPTTQPTSATPISPTTGPPNPCGNGTWVNIENRCFNFDPVVKTWADASNNCHNLGGVLVTVFDQKDEDFLYSQAQNIPFFIGLHDLYKIGDFVWDQPNGTTLTLNDTKYTNWATGQPDLDNTNYRCVIDQKGLGWMVSSCYVESFYACEKPVPGLSSSTAAVTQPGGTTASPPAQSTGTSTALPQNPCGNGTWMNIENRCFNFDAISRSWSDASSACHSQGGVLVTVFDSNDENFLYSQAQNIPFFIGLNDQSAIGTWVWDQPAGKTLTLNDTGYKNWAQGQPDTSDPNLQCVIDQRDIGWMVSSCTVPAYYACEKPTLFAVSTPTPAASQSTQPAGTATTSPSAICNGYIALAIDDTSDINSAYYNAQISYLKDTQSGLLSLYNQTLITSWYLETAIEGKFDFSGYTYDLLLQSINNQINQSNSVVGWDLLFKSIISDTLNNITYVSPAPLNTILLLGSAPPLSFENEIANLTTPQESRTVIGVLLNDQISISSNLTNAGLQIVPWNDDHSTLTANIRSKMKC